MRQIIHLDLDAFFAAVEVLLNPGLKNKALIVSMGDPKGRGVVSTASYEARRYGVGSAMPLYQAMQLCPHAIVVPVRHRIYSDYSRRVMNLLREYSRLVEQVSIDEAYIEISPEQNAVEIARTMQARIKKEIGLDATIALASNKLVSKIACNVTKPRGFIVIPEGQEEGFLAMLPVEKLPGAGKVTRSKLERWNVRTIGDLARVSVEELRKAFGKHGQYLHNAAQGRDDSPVVNERDTKSISSENTFERDTRDVARIETELSQQARDVARQLNRENVLARTIVLKLRYENFETITRQTTLRHPTRDEKEIRTRIRELLDKHWDRQRAVRLVGVGAHNLIEREEVRQLELMKDEG